MKKTNLLLLSLLVVCGCGSKTSSSAMPTSTAMTSTTSKATTTTSSITSSSSLEESTTSTSSSSVVSEEKTSSSSTNSSSSEVISSSSSEALPTDWSSEDKQTMQNYLGLTLPYCNFSVKYYLTIESSSVVDYVAINADYEDAALVDSYRLVLEASEFTLADTRVEDGITNYFYTYSLSDKKQVVVQLYYYPGEGMWPSSFTLYAWSEDIIERPATDTWTDEDQYYMYIILGDTIPFPNYSVGHILDSYTDSSTGEPTIVIYAYDERLSIVEEYVEIVEEAGYTQVAFNDSLGYNQYRYKKSFYGSFIYIEFSYFPGDEDYEPCFEIYTWYSSK